MRVLLMAPYIYDKRYPEFTRNRTGFGIMVNNIFQAISNETNAYLLSYVFTKGHGNILSHTILDVIRNLRFADIKQAIEWATVYKQNFKDRLRYAYYCLNKGAIKKAIKQVNPDIVHIHGVGLITKVFIEVCEESEIKYVITLHGLIGMDESVKVPVWEKEYEKKLMQDCDKRNIPVTVISTGIKRRIEKNYLGRESASISVVLNGTKIDTQIVSSSINLRERFRIPKNGKIAIAVGSICERKNQIAIVEAVNELVKSGITNLYVFLCGVDSTNGMIQNKIVELRLNTHIFILGFVPHDQLGNIYKQADFNIVASFDEGFGLSMIEAFVHGLPSVTFNDLDAVQDIYNNKAMMLCSNRDTVVFAKAISSVMDAEWNREWIKQYATQFSIEDMATRYLDGYKEMIKSGGGGNASIHDY